MKRRQLEALKSQLTLYHNVVAGTFVLVLIMTSWQHEWIYDHLGVQAVPIVLVGIALLYVTAFIMKCLWTCPDCKSRLPSSVGPKILGGGLISFTIPDTCEACGADFQE